MGPVFSKLGNVIEVGGRLEPIANDVVRVGQLPLFDKLLNDIYVKSGRGLQMGLVLQDFVQHEGKMRALGAVAVVIIRLIICLTCDSERMRF